MHHFEAIRVGAPESPYGHRGWCLTKIKFGELEEARVSCQRAREIFPAIIRELRQQAYRYYQGNQLENAVVYAHAAVLAGPDDAESWTQYGSFLASADQHASAVEAFRQAILLRPSTARAHNNLGYSLRKLGDLQEAIAEFKEALRLEPEYALAHHNLGETYLEVNQLHLALESFQKALEIAPDYEEVRSDLAETESRWGYLLLSEGEFEPAQDHFEASVNWRETAHGHEGLCWARLNLGDLGGAQQAGQKSVSRDHKHARGYGCLGAVEYQSGESETAVTQLKRAVDLQGCDALLWFELATVLASSGQIEEANRAYCRATWFDQKYGSEDVLEGPNSYSLPESMRPMGAWLIKRGCQTR